MRHLFALILLLINFDVQCQSPMKWPDGRQAVIVLTYDDGLASHLDVAVPQLDKANLKGTFFLNEPRWEQHISRWRAASRNGHELGNHTVFHPCLSSKFPADSRYYAENYSVAHIVREITTMNKILTAIDGKLKHSFAYPCGETSVGGKDYVDSLRRSGLVKYARAIGVSPVITDFKKLDSLQVPCKWFREDAPGAELIDFVKQVQRSRGMGVIIFHGVGGDYLQVSAEAHQQLVQYLADNRKDIWIATFEEAMEYVTGASR